MPLNLLNTKTLSVNYYESRPFLIEAYVVFGPVDEDILVVGLGNSLFALVASLAIGKHPGEGVIDGACEGQGETFFAFGDGDSPIHGLLF